MGDKNQLIYVQKYAEQLNAPYLEIGSRNYGTTQDLRPLFAGRGKYVGVDMENGPGVDVVLDLTEDFERIDAKLNGERFATIFCFSVLEHCENPFKMADNMTSLLREGGQICVGVPFSWKMHAYPNDYWRFTHEGVKRLFPKLEFSPERSFAATSRNGEFQELNDELGKISFSFSKHRKQRHILRGIFAELLKLFSRLGLLGRLGAYRHVFAPTNVLMLGQLRALEADSGVFSK
jgi:SAM-dependent methyltransferase